MIFFMISVVNLLLVACMIKFRKENFIAKEWRRSKRALKIIFMWDTIITMIAVGLNYTTFIMEYFFEVS